MKKLIATCLTLFDGEGASVGTATASAEALTGQATVEGNTEVHADGEQAQTSAEQSTVDPNAEFEKMIKGDFKQQYDERVQKIINERFKESKKAEKSYNDKIAKMEPVLTMLSERYHVDSSNPEAILQALQNDNALYEAEALEKGITVDQLKEVKKLEFQNAQLRAQQKAQEEAQQKAVEEARMRENFERIRMQAEQAKTVFPTLDLSKELENHDFARLVHSGVDVQTAYRVTHDAEITASLMANTAAKAQAQTIQNIQARNNRPNEGALQTTIPSAEAKIDFDNMSKEEFGKYLDRARRGLV